MTIKFNKKIIKCYRQTHIMEDGVMVPIAEIKKRNQQKNNELEKWRKLISAEAERLKNNGSNAVEAQASVKNPVLLQEKVVSKKNSAESPQNEAAQPSTANKKAVLSQAAVKEVQAEKPQEEKIAQLIFEIKAFISAKEINIERSLVLISNSAKKSGFFSDLSIAKKYELYLVLKELKETFFSELSSKSKAELKSLSGKILSKKLALQYQKILFKLNSVRSGSKQFKK